MRFIRLSLLALLIAVLANSTAHANYVVNGQFSTGSTLPFNLSVDAGATAGPLAGDGGLTVSTFDYSAIGGGVVNAAVFQAGSSSGTSGSPVGGELSQVLSLANASQFTFSAGRFPKSGDGSRVSIA
jgi:ethanolamine utilization protein EutA (predicted chaperonin)